MDAQGEPVRSERQLKQAIHATGGDELMEIRRSLRAEHAIDVERGLPKTLEREAVFSLVSEDKRKKLMELYEDLHCCQLDDFHKEIDQLTDALAVCERDIRKTMLIIIAFPLGSGTAFAAVASFFDPSSGGGDVVAPFVIGAVFGLFGMPVDELKKLRLRKREIEGSIEWRNDQISVRERDGGLFSEREREIGARCD